MKTAKVPQDQSNLLQEVTEGRVYFPDDEPAAIERLLKFQYTSSYNDTDILTTSSSGFSPRSELRCRYGPPGPPFASAIPTGGLFGHPLSKEYSAPVDETDPVNNAPRWTPQAIMGSALFGGPHIVSTTNSHVEVATKDQITSVLQLNIQVYALAQRFDLEDLKTQALKKIKCKEHYLRYCFLDRVLDTVYELTSPDDADLRLWLFQRCVANYKVVQLMPGAVQKLSEHGVKIAGPDRYCAWTFEVAKQTSEEEKQKYKEGEQKYEVQIRQKEKELSSLRTQFADSDTRREEEIANLKTRLKEAKERIGPQMGANGRKNREIEALQQQNQALKRDAEDSQQHIQFLRQVSNYWGPL